MTTIGKFEPLVIAGEIPCRVLLEVDYSNPDFDPCVYTVTTEFDLEGLADISTKHGSYHHAVLVFISEIERLSSDYR